MTNSKNNEKKTIKKYKVLNEKKAHKGNREKSTRVDEENKNRNTGIVKKKKKLEFVRNFKNLSGML